MSNEIQCKTYAKLISEHEDKVQNRLDLVDFEKIKPDQYKTISSLLKELEVYLSKVLKDQNTSA